jgi:E3 ubiquitin-protein ligase BRE1
VNLLDYICRDVMELQQAECRARAQVEHLKVALDEHSLELRVKAANEAEAVCQQRLTAAEAEIAELRQRLDALDRVDMELRESLKAKSEEGDAFIAEIEVSYHPSFPPSL